MNLNFQSNCGWSKSSHLCDWQVTSVVVCPVPHLGCQPGNCSDKQRSWIMFCRLKTHWVECRGGPPKKMKVSLTSGLSKNSDVLAAQQTDPLLFSHFVHLPGWQDMARPQLRLRSSQGVKYTSGKESKQCKCTVKIAVVHSDAIKGLEPLKKSQALDSMNCASLPPKVLYSPFGRCKGIWHWQYSHDKGRALWITIKSAIWLKQWT